jgi:pyridoxamine 5'-phosphate oxidase
MPEGPFKQLLARFALGAGFPDDLPPDPMPIARAWFDQARTDQVQPNPDAMTLATVDDRGYPAARIVLCRHFVSDPGLLAFFTNYEGTKGRHLARVPRAAAVFHWDKLDRQVRIEGPVVKSPAAESDEYFAKRSWEKRLGAWASDQSRPIESRAALLSKIWRTIERLGLSHTELLLKGDNVEIPRPPHWGGFRLWAERVELWLGGTGRVHDRAEWRRGLAPSGDGFTVGPWRSTRLQP